jgi:hypothetical protein
VIDLDAHQGNGVERDALRRRACLAKDGGGGSGGSGSGADAAAAAAEAAGQKDPDTFIVDAFNASVFPLDGPAKAGIDVAVRHTTYTFLRTIRQCNTRTKQVPQLKTKHQRKTTNSQSNKKGRARAGRRRRRVFGAPRRRFG